MTQTEAKTILCAELSKIYGLQEGLRMAGTVIPGIMNDFNQMLERSQCGETVREEYRLEDGRARVFVTGRRTDGNSICYERIQVTGLLFGGSTRRGQDEKFCDSGSGMDC